MSTTIPPLGTKEYLVALRDTARSEISAMRMGASDLTAYWITSSNESEWPLLVVKTPPLIGIDKLRLERGLEDHGFKDVEVRTDW